MVPKPPVIGLVAGKSGAVDSGLLTGSETDDSSVEGVANRVGLGVLEGNGRDEKIEGRLRGELEDKE